MVTILLVRTDVTLSASEMNLSVSSESCSAAAFRDAGNLFRLIPAPSGGDKIAFSVFVAAKTFKF